MVNTTLTHCSACGRAFEHREYRGALVPVYRSAMTGRPGAWPISRALCPTCYESHRPPPAAAPAVARADVPTIEPRRDPPIEAQITGLPLFEIDEEAGT